MKVHFFERKFNEDQISIEKIFGIIQGEFAKKGIHFEIFKNPFPLKKMLSAMLYFRRNQGMINHITGDIHWASLLLDPKRTVLTIHDVVGLRELTGWKKRLYFELWLNLPLKRLNYITVISGKTKKEILSYLPWAESKISVIPNCLTIAIAPDNFEKNNKIPHILIVGTRSNKNIERVIKSVQELPVKLMIVGRLSSNQIQLLNEVEIIYENFQNISDDELTKLYDQSDILCFPSLYEGFGLPILEAQARNCAVLTSDISPMNEVAGEGAVFVNPERSSEIREGIKKLLEDEDFRIQQLKSGKKNVQKYKPEEIAKQYLELYQKIDLK